MNWNFNNNSEEQIPLINYQFL